MIGTSLLFSGSIAGLLTPFDSDAPTAGYSLRNLGLSYSGAVVRVRKDITGNPEQDFTAGQITDGTLSDFLETLGTDAHSQSVSTQFEDVSDVSLICACNSGGVDELDAFDALYENGFVSKWYDQFGSNDATQTTAADQPKIWDASTGLVTENGKPALDMDNGKMSVSTITLSTMSLVFVYLRGVEDFMLTGDSNASRHRLQASVTRVYINNSDYLTALNDTSQFQKIYTTIYSSGNLDTYENGSQNNFQSGGSFTGVTGNYIIDNIGDELDVRPADGLMQEIIIYDSDQSANRTKIEDNINDYYDIY